ncbi:helix-turn-helix domain-containing protein [Epilithonimonas xixisoli]|uniref:AraC-like DNA-binding protein n=1 Tax=Epilithonimonas xixisoli TaxID=1476462 RepID=A0A4V3H317_9FLAO|nr:helix-turn-helix domain-containing protein [Epilithonimonas xixisoli]TDX87261.1 AraC-like DNA-binding protein [Epilithonimonas xixisoli]
MYKKRLFFFLSFFIISQSADAQELNLNEKAVLSSYNKNSDNVNQIKKLYLYSKKKNYKQGTLAGLLELQKHYLVSGNTTLSLKFSYEAEKLAKEIQNNESLSSIYLYRGQASARLDLYKEAKENLHKSVAYSQKITDNVEKQLQLSTIYANFAGMYEGNEHDSISHYLQKSLEAVQSAPTERLTDLQKDNYYKLLMTAYSNMGMLYTYIVQPADLDKAEPYFQKVLEFSKTAPKYFEANDLETYKAVGVFYSRKKDFKKSIEFLEKAVQIEKHKNNPRMRLLLYKEIKDSYESLSNLPKQNEYLELYSSLNDSINRADKKSIIEESRDTIKKSAETTKLNQSRDLKSIILIASALVLILVLVIWIAFYRRNQKIKKSYSTLIEKLEKEKDNQKSNFNIINDIIEDIEETVTTIDINPTEYQDNNNVNPKVAISNDTERKILKKLNAFEDSNKFLKKEISLSSMSHQINTNPRYLSDIIRTHRNQNFNSYINSLRINYIVQKLYNEPKYREYKISYLAEECGYTSSQVFVIAFKKETGFTPSYFLDNLKNDQLNIANV